MLCISPLVHLIELEETKDTRMSEVEFAIFAVVITRSPLPLLLSCRSLRRRSFG